MMDDNYYLMVLKNKLPKVEDIDFYAKLESNGKILEIKKNQKLIKFQDENKKLYFIAEGSFIRNLITSSGEVKTIMFHTESFQEFFRVYDTVYPNQKTDYELVANENSVVIEFDYEFLFQEIVPKNPELTLFFIEKIEGLLIHLYNFRNFQLGLSSEDYLNWLNMHFNFLFQRFPAQNIASFMGITPVWLSKLKAKPIF